MESVLRGQQLLGNMARLEPQGASQLRRQRVPSFARWGVSVPPRLLSSHVSLDCTQAATPGTRSFGAPSWAVLERCDTARGRCDMSAEKGPKARELVYRLRGVELRILGRLQQLGLLRADRIVRHRRGKREWGKKGSPVTGIRRPSREQPRTNHIGWSPGQLTTMREEGRRRAAAAIQSAERNRSAAVVEWLPDHEDYHFPNDCTRCDRAGRRQSSPCILRLSR